MDGKMMVRKNHGFTLIELMLFLAISGLMAMGLMIGISNAVNQQRYRDALQSFVNHLHGEYSKVVTIQNTRTDNKAKCTSSGVENDAADGRYRGKSEECSIIGRMIVPDDKAKKLESYVIYATKDVTRPNITLDDLGLIRAPQPETTYTLEWDTALSASGSNSPLFFTILLLRSPQSGLVESYKASGINTNPTEVLGKNDDFTLCVNPSGLSVADWGGVAIVTNNAVGSNAVQLVGGDKCNKAE